MKSLPKILKSIHALLPRPYFTRPRNRKLFDWLSENGKGKRILNLGSGNGNFDKYISSEIKFIKLDIDISKPDLDVVADAHDFPFRYGTFDIVYSIAVLEHVKKPWIVANEKREFKKLTIPLAELVLKANELEYIKLY